MPSGCCCHCGPCLSSPRAGPTRLMAYHRIVAMAMLIPLIMAMVVASSKGMDGPLQAGCFSVLTMGQTHLLMTSDGQGHFHWELRRWYYRDAMAPPAKRLFHRIRTSQEAGHQHAMQWLTELCSSSHCNTVQSPLHNQACRCGRRVMQQCTHGHACKPNVMSHFPQTGVAGCP